MLKNYIQHSIVLLTKIKKKEKKLETKVVKVKNVQTSVLILPKKYS